MCSAVSVPLRTSLEEAATRHRVRVQTVLTELPLLRFFKLRGFKLLSEKP